MTYAKEAYDALEHRTKSSNRVILDGLMRIDIMKVETKDQERYVVNEIEGVDANYLAGNHSLVLSTQTFLKNHWTKIIKEKLIEHL